MKKLALIYIIIASILWGTSGIFVHYMAPLGFTSLQMTFLRAVTSFLVLGIYVLVAARPLIKVKPIELLLYFGSGLSFFLTASFYYSSMQLTSISTAVILMYTAPVFVMIYSVIFFKEKLTVSKIISLIAMLIGCSLVSGIIGGLKFNIAGILFGIFSGLSYTAYNILTKIEMRRSCHPVQATFYSFFFATVIGLFFCNITAIPEVFAAKPVMAGVLGASIGIVTCVTPYFLYTVSLKHIPVGTAATLGILEPMSATVFSILFSWETIQLYSGIGIVLILAAVFLLSCSKE